MDFTNENIEPVNLPALENVYFYPLEPSYLTTKRIAMCITIVFFVVAGVIIFLNVKKLQSPILIYGAIAALIILSGLKLLVDSISFKYSGYALRDKDVLFRHGWLLRKIRVVPLNRVQHVSVQSGPIERRYKLASVSIYTAGAGAADFTIRGIREDKAQQIKEWISNQLNGAHTN